jgi:hypothetical protein
VTLTATGRTTSNTHTDRMSDRFLLLEAFCSYVGEQGLPFAAQASAASTMGRLNILNPATAPAATRSTEPRPASDAVQNRRAA